MKTASILDAYAAIVNLNLNATFNYSIYSLDDKNFIDCELSKGSLNMPPDIYQNWQSDDIAWDFVANSLNLTITGDYTPPQNIEQPVEINPESL